MQLAKYIPLIATLFDKMLDNGLRRRRSSEEDAVDNSERKGDERNDHVIIEVCPSIQIRISNQITAISRASLLKKLLFGAVTLVGMYGCYYFIYEHGYNQHPRQLQAQSVRRTQQTALRNLEKNGYTVIRKIGEGKVAEVFQVKDVGGKSWAFKRWANDRIGSDSQTRQCREEANALRKLQHTGVVPRLIKDFCEDDDILGFVMEYIDGVTLNTIGHSRKRDFQDLINHVHEAVLRIEDTGIYHRDLTGNNILVKSDGSVWIIDFGNMIDLNNIEIMRHEDYMGIPNLYMGIPDIHHARRMSPKSISLNKNILGKYYQNMEHIQADIDNGYLRNTLAEMSLYEINRAVLGGALPGKDDRKLREESAPIDAKIKAFELLGFPYQFNQEQPGQYQSLIPSFSKLWQSMKVMINENRSQGRFKPEDFQVILDQISEQRRERDLNQQQINRKRKWKCLIM